MVRDHPTAAHALGIGDDPSALSGLRLERDLSKRSGLPCPVAAEAHAGSISGPRRGVALRILDDGR